MISDLKTLLNSKTPIGEDDIATLDQVKSLETQYQKKMKDLEDKEEQFN